MYIILTLQKKYNKKNQYFKNHNLHISKSVFYAHI